MTIGGRVRALRQYYELNQTAFGARLGLSQSAIAGYENDSHAIADQTIIHICKEYRASEPWLRTGKGFMFEESTDELDAIGKQLNLNAFQLRLLRIVHDMPVEQQRLIQQIAHQIADEDLHPPESENDRALRIARAALEEHDRQQAELQEGNQA